MSMEIHLISYHYAASFKCGRKVSDLVDRRNEWGKFNKMRTTTIREATCRECLEWAYNNKKKELREIGQKLGQEWITQ